MKDHKIKSYPVYETLLKKQTKKRNRRFFIFSIANALVFLVLGAFLSISILGNFRGIASRDVQYKKLMQAYEIVSRDWYFGEGESSNQDFVERALLAMMNAQSEDAYLTYYPLASLESDFGLGITVTYMDGYLLIQEVYSVSPSYGELFPGDIISKVNNQELRGMLFADIVPLIRGEAGTTLSLEVIRQQTILQKQLTRGISRNATIHGYTQSDYGVLQIKGFENDTVQGARAVLDGFVTNHINKLVIDLRNNGGGYIMAFEALSDLFTPKGAIFGVYKHKDARDNYAAKSQNNARYHFEHIVILVNQNTASAAESFTAALQDNLASVQVVGIQSYGKGIAQKTITFQDGSQLRYTYAEYYRPNDVKLHQVGITPDVVLDTSGAYKIMQRAFFAGETWNQRLLEYLIARGFGAPSFDEGVVLLAYQQVSDLTQSGVLDKQTLVQIMQDYADEKQVAETTQLQQAALIGS